MDDDCTGEMLSSELPDEIPRCGVVAPGIKLATSLEYLAYGNRSRTYDSDTSDYGVDVVSRQ